jgi:hypothetical protein
MSNSYKPQLRAQYHARIHPNYPQLTFPMHAKMITSSPFNFLNYAKKYININKRENVQATNVIVDQTECP